MKKVKLFSFLVLPLTLGSAGILYANKLAYKDNEINLEIKTKQTTEEILNRGHIKDFSLGKDHSAIVVKSPLGEDYLYTWGDNSRGQLGYESDVSIVATPTKVEYFPSNTEIKNVELGWLHSGVVVTDSSGSDHLYMWGDNSNGQLGINIDDPNSHYSTPTEVDFGFGDQKVTIDKFSLGKYHSIAVLIDENEVEHIFTWGTYSEKNIAPIDITSDFLIDGEEINFTNVKDIDAGETHSGAILTDEEEIDHLYMWGKYDFGQLGIGQPGGLIPTYIKPTEVEFVEKEIKDISLGNGNSAVIVTDDKGVDQLYTWGNDNFGQLGMPNTSIPFYSPQNISWKFSRYNLEMKELNINGENSSIVLIDENGNENLYAWGKNDHGQLGVPSDYISSSSTPQKILLSTEGEIKTQFGYGFASALVKDENEIEHFYIWGSDDKGQLGNGDQTGNVYTPTENNYLTEIELSTSTKIVEQVSTEEFIFGVDTLIPTDLSQNIEVYNDEGVKVGTTNSIIEENNFATLNEKEYLFDVVVTDFDNASNELLYWSYDDGTTLNLISNDTYEFKPTTTNPSNEDDYSEIIMYSIIGIIILSIIIGIAIIIINKKSNK